MQKGMQHAEGVIVPAKKKFKFKKSAFAGRKGKLQSALRISCICYLMAHVENFEFPRRAILPCSRI
jgi:hypothetical protein